MESYFGTFHGIQVLLTRVQLKLRYWQLQGEGLLVGIIVTSINKLLSKKIQTLKHHAENCYKLLPHTQTRTF